MRIDFFKHQELFKEIILNLKLHRIRTILTAFGIAWGVFILVVLLGISGGVQEGVTELFKGFTKKTVWFYGGKSDKNIAFRETGKEIKFDISEMENLKRIFPKVAFVSPEIQKPWVAVFFQNEIDFYNVIGVNDQTLDIKSLVVNKGRKINLRDINEANEVAIIGDRAVKRFFAGLDPIGKQIEISGQNFLIVGVVEQGSALSMNEYHSIFIPYTTFSQVVAPVRQIGTIAVTFSGGEIENLIKQIKSYLARKYYFDVDDSEALYIVNYEEQMTSFKKFFSGFNIFLLFVGCCMLLSGIIGVSNIMYIIVKERTREIGVKKALGATSSSVLREFLLESLILTLLAGLVGLILGYGTLRIIDLLIDQMLEGNQFLSSTKLDPIYLLFALIILSVSGLLAGFFPALKAAEIRPIEAMKVL